MKLRTLILGLMLLSGHYCLGQNLILNPDVELENICTEHLVACEPKAWWNTTVMITAGYNKEPSHAYSGSHSLLIIIANRGPYPANHSYWHIMPTDRSYWQTMLPCSLQKGKRYRISFYIGSLYSGVDPTLISLLFSDTLIMRQNPGLISGPPNVTFTQENIHKVRHSRWLKIEKDFSPDQNYRVILFGNFSTNPDAADIKNAQGQIMYVLDKFNLVCLNDAGNLCGSYHDDSLAIMTSRPRHTVPLPRIIPTQVLLSKSSSQEKEIKSIPSNYSIDTISFPNVLFKVNSSELNLSYLDTLRFLGKRINERELKSMQIVGYTDNSGSDSLNSRLSYLRARSVFDFLTKNFSLDTTKIRIVGKGAQDPQFDNSTPEGRSKNRRVEIYLYYDIEEKNR